jgi:hypothetical protein
MRREGPGGTGYAVDRGRNKVCYECCGEHDRQELRGMTEGAGIILYLVNHDSEVTNWPGTLRIKVAERRKGKHNIARKRVDVGFTFEGRRFHGVQYGENTQICHVKRINA